jgi:hypothetical protein
VCDRVLFLKGGLVARAETILSSDGHVMVIRLVPGSFDASAVEQIAGSTPSDNTIIVSAATERDVAAIVRRLINSGADIVEVRRQTSDLESLFLRSEMNTDVVVETVRRHLTSAGYIAYGVLIALTGLLAATFNKPASMWPALVTVLSIITGAAVIGPESSTATLQLIVSRPIRRSVYLISRVTGVLLSVAFAAMVGGASEAIGRLLIGSHEVPGSC